MGVRLILTLYILTKKRIPFLTYLSLTFIGNIIFISVLFPIGWFLGRGIVEAFSLGKNFSSLGTLFILIGIGSQVILYGIRLLFRFFSKKYNQ